MAMMRWDEVNSTADFLNGVGATSRQLDRAFSFTVPIGPQPHHARLKALVHANIKASFEYQIRPQQVVYDPTTGQCLSPVAFRTNSAIAGLEFVY